jgi:hypothetical protein
MRFRQVAVESGIGRPPVRLDHASRLDQLEAAFKAFGRTVDVSI